MLIFRALRLNFWKWRSDQYDASFLRIGSDKEIKEWFERFIEEILIEESSLEDAYDFFKS